MPASIPLPSVFAVSKYMHPIGFAYRSVQTHPPLQELNADISFPGLGTEDKNIKRMSGSIVSILCGG